MKYSELCETYEKLEATSKRLEKTEILSSFLKKLKPEDKEIIYLIKGRVFPDYDARELGISTQLTIKALSKSTGISKKEIVNSWKKLGDLGKVAEEAKKAKKQSALFSSHLTTEKVLANLKKLPELFGKGTVEKKLSLISELLTSASPLEARYIIRTLIGDLRVGVGEGVLRDAIVWACFSKEDKESYIVVQEAYDKSTDFALVFEKARQGKKDLENLSLSPGKPVKVMLFLKEENIEKGFERVGKPCLIDFKYDGFRMMINKDEKGNIKIFTRRLENVTAQFPEVVEYIKKYVKADSFILDSEAVGFSPKTLKYKPFQEISQRIKRKYNIEKLQKELPIELNVFDILYYNNKSLIKTPFRERRKIIEKIIKNQKRKIKVSEAIITDSEKEAYSFYKKALEEGQEGVMMKNLEAPYKPGARVGYGIKIKPKDREFDLVITGAEYGTGKRAGWLTSYDVSCLHEGKLLEIGKVSTGLKEKESEGLSFKEMTKILKPSIKKEEGKHVLVKPEIVVSVTYQNIQKSPTYSSGFALRFPRITRLRPDRSVKDIATLSEIKKEAGK